MDRKVAKDLLHVRDWLDRARDIVSRGQDATLKTRCFKKLATR